MLLALLVKVGIPLAGVAIGWLAKKLHAKPAVEAAFQEGVNVALDNAAMKAHDMGHPAVRDAINELKSAPR